MAGKREELQLANDIYWLEEAELASRHSPDPSMKCGSVIVNDDDELVGMGWNDMPRGCSQSEEIWNNRPLKYERVVHGEVSAVIDAGNDARGATIYCWPPGIGPSCARCTAVIIQSGIKRVVFVQTGEENPRWSESVKIGLEMYKEAGVEVVGVPVEEYNGLLSRPEV